MSKVDEGGPAFPQLCVEACGRDGHGDVIEPFTSISGGMTLRDYFAAQALAGGLLRLLFDDDPVPGTDYPMHVSQTAYEFADAMLAVRKEPT